MWVQGFQMQTVVVWFYEWLPLSIPFPLLLPLLILFICFESNLIWLPPWFVSAARQSRDSRFHGEELQEETSVRCVQAEHRQPRGFLQGWVHADSQVRQQTHRHIWWHEHTPRPDRDELTLTVLSLSLFLCLSKNLTVGVNLTCSLLTLCRMQGCCSQGMWSKGKPMCHH